MLPRPFIPPRLALPLRPSSSTHLHYPPRRFQSSSSPPKPLPRQGSPHITFYKVYGRALLKALTLAFLSYQVVYWAWLTLETEELKDQKNVEVRTLENEVRLMETGRNGHLGGEKRLLEEDVGQKGG